MDAAGFKVPRALGAAAADWAGALPTPMGANAPTGAAAPSASSPVTPSVAPASEAELLSLLGDRYALPPWSGRVEGGRCCLEVTRGGVILDSIDLTTKQCYVVGRQPNLDIPLEHPSVSRLHAIIQMRASGQVYVYDLGSTHGTFWNKTNRINPSVHVPVKVGDLLRFGQSTRFFVLAGDIYDRHEAEDKRERQHEQKKEAALQRLRQQRVVRLLEDQQVSKRTHELAVQDALRHDSCTWGMGDGPDAALGPPELPDTQFDDDDEFYDRTGDVKRKEVQRNRTEVVCAESKRGAAVTIRLVRKKETPAALTARLTALRQDLDHLTARLTSLADDAPPSAEAEEDGLDDLINLTRQQEATAKRRILEIDAAKVRKEIAEAERLLGQTHPSASSRTEALAPPSVQIAAAVPAEPVAPPPRGVFSITKEREEEHRDRRTQERAAREERHRDLLERIQAATKEDRERLREEREAERGIEEELEAQPQAGLPTGSLAGAVTSDDEDEADPKAAAVVAKLKRRAPPTAAKGSTASGLAALLARVQTEGFGGHAEGEAVAVPLDDDADAPDPALLRQAEAIRKKRQSVAEAERQRAIASDEKARAFVDGFGENQDKEAKRRRQGLDPSEEVKAKKRATFRGAPGKEEPSPSTPESTGSVPKAKANPKAAFHAVQKAIMQRGGGPRPVAAAPAPPPPTTATEGSTVPPPIKGPVKGPAADWWRGAADPTEWAPPSDQSGDGRTSLNDRLGY